MIAHRTLAAATTVAALSTAALASAQSLTIDAFDSGRQRPIVLRSSPVPRQESAGQRGTMLGEYRLTIWTIAADTLIADYLEGREGRFEVEPDRGVLAVDTGVDVVHHLQVHYGFDHRGESDPLNQDLSPYDRMTLRFHALDGVLVANIIFYTNDGADVFQLGQADLGSPAPHPLPFAFADFISNVTGLPPTAADLADVDRIDVLLQSGGRSIDFAIEEIVCEVAE